MTYIEDKKHIFRSFIGDLYYKGPLGYNDIYIIALIYFKYNLDRNEITYNEVKEFVFKEINELIDLD